MSQPEDNIDAGGAITDLVFDEITKEGDLGGFVTLEFQDLSFN